MKSAILVTGHGIDIEVGNCWLLPCTYSLDHLISNLFFINEMTPMVCYMFILAVHINLYKHINTQADEN